MAGQDVAAFGKQLRDFRQAAGLTREVLAEQAGLSTKAIGALERGERRHPYPHTIRVLADALGLSGDQRAIFAAAGARREKARLSSTDGAGPSHLPVPPTPIVGRRREVAEVCAMVQGGARLVTLTGAGGVGKTRLALEVVRELAGHFAGSTAIVPLAPLSDAAFVLSTVAHALGLSGAPPLPAGEVLHNYLRDRHLLLVLDNLEHLLEAAPEIATLIELCPQLVVLATSRAPLRLRGEREYPVGPLPVPSLSRVPEVADIVGYPAVALFVERARDVYPEFELTDSNATAVAAICRRLDGLPLALELAAARIRVLDPTTMLARLDRALPVLTGGSRDLPERQRTMEAAIGWSYDLLEPAEQVLFRRLSVFAGGWDLHAAAAVGRVGEHTFDEVLDLLASLVERSLVVVHRGERVRYRMLEPVRQYAMEQLSENGAVEEARWRHAEWYLEYAEQAEPALRLRARDDESLNRLEADRDNLQEAIAWALSRGQPELSVRLAYALWEFYWERGNYAEVLGWMEEALRAGDQLSTGGRARGRFVAELMRFRLGGHAGLVPAFEEIFTVFEEEGHQAGAADALMFAGLASLRAGDMERAETLLSESGRRFESMGDERRVAVVLVFLGAIPLNRGDFEQAEGYFERGSALGRALGDAGSMYPPLYHLALAAQGKGEHARAQRFYQEVLPLGHSLRDRAVVGVALVGLAECAAALGEPQRAAQLFGAAEAVLGSVGMSFHPFNTSAAFHERFRKLAQNQIGQEGFDAAWAKGRAMAYEQAIAYATVDDPARSEGEVGTLPPGPAGPNPAAP